MHGFKLSTGMLLFPKKTLLPFDPKSQYVPALLLHLIVSPYYALPLPSYGSLTTNFPNPANPVFIGLHYHKNHATNPRPQELGKTLCPPSLLHIITLILCRPPTRSHHFHSLASRSYSTTPAAFSATHPRSHFYHRLLHRTTARPHTPPPLAPADPAHCPSRPPRPTAGTPHSMDHMSNPRYDSNTLLLRFATAIRCFAMHPLQTRSLAASQPYRPHL